MAKSGFKLPKSVKNVNPILTINVRGDVYNIFLHTQKDLNKILPDCEAFVQFQRNEIRFHEENHSLAVIIHELIHCFIHSTYIKELTELDTSDFEEIVCEVVSNNYVNIYNMAKKVKRALNEEISKRRENHAKSKAK